jgi:two-component system, sensor histidine kinase and response regulator
MKQEPIKFLVVDDTEENLVALEALLRREGVEIHKARSGREALELLLVHDFALALLDVHMPAMDGFELAELMRGAERSRNVPIIFLTAGARDPQRVFKGYESGAVDFLFKPIEPHVLQSKAGVFFDLYRQRRELAGALHLNEMFVGILGHDLRNPLGAVLSGAQVLERQLSEEIHLRTVQRMLAGAQRMKSMIEQMLDLTRARLAGGLGFARVRERLDVGNLIRRTVEELRGAHPSVEVQLQVQGDVSTSGDPDRLLQLFSNLVANAIDHGTAGSAVSVLVEGGDSEIAVQVHNRGRIPDDILPTIFDPFRGRERKESSAGGLGLGLFISKQIVAAHAGDLDVDTTESGTTFTVRLPRRSSGDRPVPA